MSGRIYDMLKIHEGVEDRPYKCTAGKITIGVGRNLEDKGLSLDEIEYLLRNDIRDATSDMIDVIGVEYMKTLSDAQFDCLVMMSFNLGKTRFASFKKMIKAVQEGDFKRAQKEMLDSRWADQVGKRANDLAELMGDY